jgi:diacylglycerol kinase family enzyme
VEAAAVRWLAILNPAAHNGVGPDHLRCLARTLHRQLGAECAWTSHPHHAREIAHGSQGFDGCIAVGGDGTIAEVVNGMDLKRQCLGIVPAGTANGLAHDLDMLDVPAALQVLRRPRVAPLDLIRVRYHSGQCWQEQFVVHTSGLGYVAGVVALGIGPLKRLGSLRYAAAACLQCCRQRPFVARLRIDEGAQQELLLTNLVVNNTRHAGHFCLFPHARLQDGRLNLLYGRIPAPRQLLEDLGILTQTYLLEWSLRREGQAVEVDLPLPAALMLDGELIPNVGAVRFEVVRGCLHCVAGRAPGLK